MKVILRIVGVLLIVAAVTLFFWQDIREHFTDQVNDRIIEGYQNGDDHVDVNSFESLITGIDPENGDSSESSGGNNDTAEASGIHIDDNMAGVLRIPSADINEPLYHGPVTEEKMRNGVSFVHDDDHPDMQNIPIAGHRVEGAGIRFNNLDQASVGDSVRLVTHDTEREYQITDIFEVEPSEVGVMDQREGQPQELTLITCEDYNPETLLFEKRMIVKAEIVE